MAVTDQGYLRPTFDELLEQNITLAEELFGEDVDTSNASPLGKYIRLMAQDMAQAYEENELLYYAAYPHTATGQNLDRLMPFAGITRNPATRAEHEIKFTGKAEHTIPPGFLVGTTGDEQFYLVNPVTLGSDGTGVGIVQCTEAGTVGNVQLGSITEIINPDVNVLEVEHTNIETFGEDAETDPALRVRFGEAIEGSGSATVAAIRGAIMRVNGVRGCRIVENEENETDAEGRPPHSFEAYVRAPESLDQEVAEAIFAKKPLGIKSVGDVAIDVVDVSGDSKTVYFSRVAEVVIHIKATVATDGTFELDGVEQIKTALLAYINGLSTGDDVVYTALYRHIFGVTGVRDVPALAIAADGGGYASANITIGTDQIPTVDAANISIEVTGYADT